MSTVHVSAAAVAAAARTLQAAHASYNGYGRIPGALYGHLAQALAAVGQLAGELDQAVSALGALPVPVAGSLAEENARLRAQVAELEAQVPYREVWDSGLPPGGLVCSVCGQPVESEPCPQHAQQGSFLRPWSAHLDAKSLDNFLIDLGRATECEPLDAAVAEIEATVARWRAWASEQERVRRSVDAQFPVVAAVLADTDGGSR
ncbi:hypothetical protein AMK26_10540 [Streptomyces sp. CB03234]|uniref:hypothetical protein n=1 Tax=Streptomyces sp. (strain CB03234) TaxID=1703937 RepID=UPI00094029EC|nr:hypothetical protein [Streptomyces sp. CB03234]OKK06446.1 hypothetical protein AMK26_10540 [Streptomyces sp. CB03234]